MATPDHMHESRRLSVSPPPSLARRVRLLLLPRGSWRERLAGLGKATLLGTSRGLQAWWSAVRGAAKLALPQSPQSGPTAPPPTLGDVPLHFAGEVPHLVSVVLPVYNQASLLGDAIASVLAQTYTALELIVVSDGSTDGVETVFDRFVDDPRIRFLVQPNQKLPKALSNGFDLARGEFWTWTSADNLMEPHQLERLVEFLRRRPDVALVFADYWAIDDRGHMLVDPSFRPPNRRTPTSPEIHLPQDVTGYHEGADNYIGPCFLYRGSAGRILGEYAPELGVEDYEYWLRMSAIMRIAHLGTDELLYRYRVHENSLCAHAEELGIYQRRDRLLAIDRRRRSDLANPWHTTADPELEGALGRNPGRRPAGIVAGHAVRIVSPAQLATALTEAPSAYVVAWFDDSDPEAPYRHRLAIPDAKACLAADATMADRLALFTSQAFLAPDRARVRACAELHAKAARLRTLEQMPAQWRRTPARVRLPGNRSVRVLLQVDHFAQGGREQVVLDLGRTLREAGADVQLLVRHESVDAVAAASAAGVPVVHFTSERHEHQYAELLRVGFDVINAHDSTFGADIAATHGVPFVQTVHDGHVWLTAPEAEEVRAAIPATAAFTCVSAEVARCADVVLGVPPAKLIVLPSGIELHPQETRLQRDNVRAELDLGVRDFVFLQVASLCPVKAQRIAVHALRELHRQHPEAKLLLAGHALDPDYAALVAREARNLGLGDAVRFLGHRHDLASLLALSDAFLLPSYWEGWSLAAAEAAVAGLPIVLSDVGAAREQVAVAGGRLVPPPFASITQVRRESLHALIHAVQPSFVAAVAAAMRDACDGQIARPDVERCRAAFDRRLAYGQHLRLLQWLAAGGSLASARQWLRHPQEVASPLHAEHLR